MTWIDSHVHIWTADYHQYPLAEGVDENRVKPRHFPPEVFLRYARPSFVSRVVLVQTINYNFDNSYMLDAVERFPEMFRLAAIVDHTRADVADRMRSLLNRGVTGFRIVAPEGEGDRWLQHPGYDTMFETAAETGQAICPLIGPDGIAEVDRMCAAHPGTNVVVDHLARVGEDDPAQNGDVDALCNLARHPRAHVKASRFHSLGEQGPPHDDLAPLIERVVAAFGAERVMWGSDSPHQVANETYKDSIALVRDRLEFLSDEDRRQILAGTAERVFFFR